MLFGFLWTAFRNPVAYPQEEVICGWKSGILARGEWLRPWVWPLLLPLSP
jgi:hypothetical protein